MATSRAPVIAQNEESTIVLIDIPTSIVNAQFNGDHQSDLALYSCSAVSEPYISTEPKSVKAKQRVIQQAGDPHMHSDTCQLIHNSLKWVHDSIGEDGEYCHARVIPSSSPSLAEKRTADRAFDVGIANEDRLLERMASTPTTFQVLEDSDNKLRLCDANEQLRANTSMFQEHFAGFWRNQTDETGLIQYANSKDSIEKFDVRFFVPPHCACLLGDCHNVSNYRSAVRSFESAARGRFDLILMDPPWPNRSASRKSSYGTHSDLKSIRSMLLSMDLDASIVSGGFIAVWVTNRPACRDLVLGAHGLFKKWNVSFEEEWIWVKVTSSGEPVTPVDGLWRKPFETLLIGKAPFDRMAVAREASEVKKRVVIAVPDLHSRKPCLKDLFEKLLIQRCDHYTALEIFARHLVAGWFSWGTEVLKYNWEGHWSKKSIGATEPLNKETMNCGIRVP